MNVLYFLCVLLQDISFQSMIFNIPNPSWKIDKLIIEPRTFEWTFQGNYFIWKSDMCIRKSVITPFFFFLLKIYKTRTTVFF